MSALDEPAQLAPRRMRDLLREACLNIAALAGRHQSCDYLDRFAIKAKEVIRFVLVEHLTRIESAGVYVNIHACDEQVLY